MRLKDICRVAASHIVCDIKPAWNDDEYEPIVNHVSERTSYSPSWIDERLREWAREKDLSDITPGEVIHYLKKIPAATPEAFAGPARVKPEPAFKMYG